jgi:type 1 glutamine amidotransferase
MDKPNDRDRASFWATFPLIVAFATVIAFPGTGETQEQPAAGTVRHRVLLLGQKPDGHPAATHEYMAGVQLLARMLSRTPGVQAIVVPADSPWKEGPELLDGADAAVVFLSEGARWVTEEPQRLAAFQRLAKRGGGLACLHWGMGTREAAPIADFTSLFGGCHGGPDRKYKVVSVTATPAPQRHSILSGIVPFEVRDEFYYALKRPAEDRKFQTVPLILVPIDGNVETVAWAGESPDGGRSFGFSGLHFHENWKLAEYRRLVLQGILWTIKQPIPEGGMPVNVTAGDLALPPTPHTD